MKIDDLQEQVYKAQLLVKSQRDIVWASETSSVESYEEMCAKLLVINDSAYQELKKMQNSLDELELKELEVLKEQHFAENGESARMPIMS